MTNPWWLENAETGKRRKFNSYDEAKEAGIKAYNKLKSEGKYAEDSFYLLSGGEYLGIAALATN